VELAVLHHQHYLAMVVQAHLLFLTHQQAAAAAEEVAAAHQTLAALVVMVGLDLSFLFGNLCFIKLQSHQIKEREENLAGLEFVSITQL
jgi:hypothetical protein